MTEKDSQLEKQQITDQITLKKENEKSQTKQEINERTINGQKESTKDLKKLQRQQLVRKAVIIFLEEYREMFIQNKPRKPLSPQNKKIIQQLDELSCSSSQFDSDEGYDSDQQSLSSFELFQQENNQLSIFCPSHKGNSILLESNQNSNSQDDDLIQLEQQRQIRPEKLSQLQESKQPKGALTKEGRQRIEIVSTQRKNQSEDKKTDKKVRKLQKMVQKIQLSEQNANKNISYQNLNLKLCKDSDSDSDLQFYEQSCDSSDEQNANENQWICLNGKSSKKLRYDEFVFSKQGDLLQEPLKEKSQKSTRQLQETQINLEIVERKEDQDQEKYEDQTLGQHQQRQIYLD